MAELFPTTGTNHVGQSQAMSALVKTVRLRQTDDALYWFSHFARFFPDQRFRLSRRLMIIAAEDNLNVPVQQAVSEWFGRALSKNVSTEVWYRGAAAMIHLICATPNWWRDSSGSHYVCLWRRAEKRWLEMSKEWTDVEKKKLAAWGVIDFDKPATSFISHFAKNATGEWGDYGNKGEYAKFLVEESRKRLNLPARLTAGIHARWAGPLSGDDNYLGQALYRLCYGSLGLNDYPAVLPEQVKGSIERVMKRLANPEKPPAYTQDGVHSGGSDRRFAGMVANMVACANAFRHYGRLHPDDQHPSEFFSTTLLLDQLKNELPAAHKEAP